MLANFGGHYIKGVGGFLFTTLVHWFGSVRWFVTIKNGFTVVVR
jgi:uncharacterized protein YhhL (DUF1145 family)